MKTRWRAYSVLAGMLLLAVTVPLPASTFLALTAEEMVTQSNAVIQGRVIGVESFWSEQGRLIVTEATIEVGEVLLGSAPSQVRVRTFGGRVGDVNVVAYGFPTFRDDEEVILFLTAAEGGAYRVLGYQQGQFEVVERLDGVTLAVPMVEDGARYYTRSGVLMPEPRSTEIGRFKANLRTTARRFLRAAN